MIGDLDVVRTPQTWVSSTGRLALSWSNDAVRDLDGFATSDCATAATMSPQRAAEFTMGRVCARTAIRTLGGGHEDLGRLPNGSIAWPSG